MKYPLILKQLIECMQWANEMGLYVQTYEGDNYFFEKHTPYSDLYAKGIGIEGEEVPGMTSRKESSFAEDPRH